MVKTFKDRHIIWLFLGFIRVLVGLYPRKNRSKTYVCNIFVVVVVATNFFEYSIQNTNHNIIYTSVADLRGELRRLSTRCSLNLFFWTISTCPEVLHYKYLIENY